MAVMERVVRYIKKHRMVGQGVVVAMSGGVDSGLVAYAAKQALGLDCLAVTVVSEVSSPRDIALAQNLAREIGIEHHVLLTQVLDLSNVKKNDSDRCYYCKLAIFGQIKVKCPGHMLMDGTNADDDATRPGLRAASELGVCSPLKVCGIKKKTVRRLARKNGLSNWDVPSESCLATRIKSGVPLTVEGLQMVQRMESFFHERGVHTLRAYHDNLVATVEYLPQYADIMIKCRDKFAALVAKIGLLSFEFKEFRQ